MPTNRGGRRIPGAAMGGGGSDPVYTPDQFSGLVLWLADTSTKWQDSARTVPAVADGDPVGAWDDLSGAGSHALQATAGKRPLLKLGALNGLPVLRLDGTDDFLASALSMAQAAVTIFVVANLTNATATRTLVGASAAGGFQFRAGITTRFLSLMKQSTSTIITSALAAALGAGSVSTALYTQATGAAFARLNGVSNSATSVQTLTASTAIVGANAGTSEFWIGDIAEIAAYNRVLTVPECQAVERALGIKYVVAIA